jgi:hypothetical protein
MATTSARPVTRETSAYVRERGHMRAVMVTITGSILEFRCKGLRSKETLDVASLYYQAVKARVADEKAAKRKARKAK